MKKAILGVTLIELIMSIVIIGIAVVGVFSAMAIIIQRSASPLMMEQSLAIAQSYLDEILSKGYCNVGSATTVRANFNDVCDYSSLTDVGVRDQFGNAVVGLENYTVSVTVANGVLSTLTTNVLRVDVRVTDPKSAVLLLTGYRTNHTI